MRGHYTEAVTPKRVHEDLSLEGPRFLSQVAHFQGPVSTLRAHSETKRERLETDRAAMLAFPKTAFESRKVSYATANSLSLVRFDRNDYSVPTAYAHQSLTVIGAVETVPIVAQGHW